LIQSLQLEKNNPVRGRSVGGLVKAGTGGDFSSAFDDFLKADGIDGEMTARAIKRVIASQLDALPEHQELTKIQVGQADEDEPRPARPHPRSRQRIDHARHADAGGAGSSRPSIADGAGLMPSQDFACSISGTR
jgi:hypothetical protein